MTPAASLEIRPASFEDAARIRDLTRAAYAKWAALIGREPLPMQADYDRAVREHSIDLLTVAGALVGLIETIVRPDHLWIENVAVAPDRQGRGYGRMLLAHAERRAAEAGARRTPPHDQCGLRRQSRALCEAGSRSTEPSRSAAGRRSYEQARCLETGLRLGASTAAP